MLCSWGYFCPLVDVWQCLRTFLGITTRWHMLVASIILGIVFHNKELSGLKYQPASSFSINPDIQLLSPPCQLLSKYNWNFSSVLVLLWSVPSSSFIQNNWPLVSLYPFFLLEYMKSAQISHSDPKSEASKSLRIKSKAFTLLHSPFYICFLFICLSLLKHKL